MPDYEKNIILPLAKKTYEDVGALYVIIFFLAIFIFSKPVFASNVYYQPIYGDDIEWSLASTTLIGSFVLSSPSDFAGGSVQFRAGGFESPCKDTPFGWVIDLATTTDYESSESWVRVARSAESAYDTEGNYHTFLQSWTDFTYGSTLDADTYYVFGTPMCNGGLMKMSSDYTGSFYGLLSDSGGFSELLPVNETYFTQLVPGDGLTRASSTSNTLYVYLNVSTDDEVDGAFVRLKYVRQQDLQSAVANSELLWTTFNFDDLINSAFK